MSTVFLLDARGATPADAGPLTQTVTVHGSASDSSAQQLFSNNTLLISTSADAVGVPDHANFDISGVELFTIRLWVYPTDLAGTGEIDIFASQYDVDDELGWRLVNYGGAGGGVWFEFWEPGFYSGIGCTWTPTLDAWNHVAIDFNGTHFRIYGGGVMQEKDTHVGIGSPGDIANATAALLVGNQWNAGVIDSNPFRGHIAEAEFIVGTAEYNSDSGYTPPVVSNLPVDLDDEIIEGLEFEDVSGMGDVYFDTLTETLGTTQTILPGWLRTASDTISLSYLLTEVYRQAVTVSETLGLAPNTAPLAGVVLTEVLGLAPSALPNQIANISAADTVRIIEQLLPGLPTAISETLGLAITEVIQQATTVIEELDLAPLLTGNAIYNLSYADVVGLAESLANFLGADITDAINIQPLVGGSALMPGALTETLGLTETLNPQMILRVTVDEELIVDDDQLLNSIYNGTVADGIEITAAYLSPGGGFTTWAMNTRTAAVTEYDNYQFNSFAAMGNRYLGANENGLYELNGEDDDGEDIIAHLKSGFAQWAGARFTLFKSIYLGVRGEGDFVLRLITGDGNSYDYAVSTRNMRSTKVHLGKGLRARYFAFELISEGQDFDLESVEFVPLIADRRV